MQFCVYHSVLVIHKKHFFPLFFFLLPLSPQGKQTSLIFEAKNNILLKTSGRLNNLVQRKRKKKHWVFMMQFDRSLGQKEIDEILYTGS